MADKNLVTLLKVLPRLVLAGEVRGTLRSLIHQWGLVNALRIVAGIARRLGFVNNIKYLLQFRLDKIVPHQFVAMWDVFGDREAIISGDRRITYRELKDRVFRLSNGLRSLGLKPKDKVAELLYNGNQFFETFLAASLMGCPMPFLNWHMKGDELADAINRASPRVLVLDEAFVDEVRRISGRIPGVERFVVVGKDAPEGMIPYEDLIARASPEEPEFNFIIALNPYTGGTTGTPKNINYFDTFGYAFSDLSEAPSIPFGEYLWFLFRQFSFIYWFGGTTIRDHRTRNMRCLIPGPLYHAGTIAGWAPFLVLGSTAVPMKCFEPEEFLKIVESERINWAFVVPTMLERILHSAPGVCALGELHCLWRLDRAAITCSCGSPFASNC